MTTGITRLVFVRWFAARLYSLISTELANTRLFNAFLNLQPILASALLALLVGQFGGQFGRFVTEQAWAGRRSRSPQPARRCSP
jgi:hypothetical protein